MAFIEKQGKGRHSVISLIVFSFREDLQLLKEEFQILSEDSIWHPVSNGRLRDGPEGWALGSSEGLRKEVGRAVGRDTWEKRSRILRRL